MLLFDYFATLPWILGSMLVMACFVGFTICGLILIRKNYKPEYLRGHHDVAGFVYANLGALYAVLLGFTVVNAQARFDKIANAVETEAGYIAALYRDAGVYPEENTLKIRAAITHYTTCLLEDEWQCMTREVRSQATEAAFNALWDEYYRIEPATPRLQVWFSESVAKLHQLMQARLCRILDSQASLGNEMWAFLIFGGLSMMSFIWFFGIENRTAHLLMAAVLAAVIAYLLFLVYSLDSAMSGSVSISPSAIRDVLKTFE